MFARKSLRLPFSILLVCALCSLSCAAAFVVPKHAWAASSGPTVSVARAATGKLVMKKGARYKLGATASAGTLTYASSKPKVVSVSKKGVLKARKVGKATITVKASSGGSTAVKRVKVTVVKASKFKRVTKITMSVASQSLAVGSSTKATVAFTPKKASNQNVVFASSNSKVVAVAADGTITAKSAGSAKVTAKSCDNAKASASVTITVASADQVDGVEVQAELSGYTWAQLKAIANKISSCGSADEVASIAKKYNLTNSDGMLEGACKELTLSNGTTCQVRILGFLHDDKTDGGKAGITFEFADIPASATVNSLLTNENGWYVSAVRSWLNGNFAELLPDDVLSSIVPIDKKTNNVGMTYVAISEHHNTNWIGCVTKTYNEKLWLLSVSELYGKLASQSSSIWSPSTYDAEGTQYQLYSDCGVSVANCGFCVKRDAAEGKAQSWWLRSPDAMNSTNWYGIDDEGNPLSDGASVSHGISPCFCF